MTKKTTTGDVFDLSALDAVQAAAEEGAVCQIIHPVTEEPIPGMTIRVAGRESARFKKAQQILQNRLLKARRAARPTAEMLEDQACELLARVTLSWGGFMVDGEQLECTVENAIMVYKRFPTIREQVDAFVNDLSNFTKS